MSKINTPSDPPECTISDWVADQELTLKLLMAEQPQRVQDDLGVRWRKRDVNELIQKAKKSGEKITTSKNNQADTVECSDFRVKWATFAFKSVCKDFPDAMSNLTLEIKRVPIRSTDNTLSLDERTKALTEKHKARLEVLPEKTSTEKLVAKITSLIRSIRPQEESKERRISSPES